MAHRAIPLIQGNADSPEAAIDLDALKVVGVHASAKPFIASRSMASSSGFRGVSSQGRRWRARICISKLEYT